MGEASQPLNRTKVYLLNDDGQWDDRGTGHAEIQYMPAEDAAFIIVMSEENAETSLLQTKIHMQDIYQRQQDTIISWNEPDTGVDYAHERLAGKIWVNPGEVPGDLFNIFFASKVVNI